MKEVDILLFGAGAFLLFGLGGVSAISSSRKDGFGQGGVISARGTIPSEAPRAGEIVNTLRKQDEVVKEVREIAQQVPDSNVTLTNTKTGRVVETFTGTELTKMFSQSGTVNKGETTFGVEKVSPTSTGIVSVKTVSTAPPENVSHRLKSDRLSYYHGN